VHDHLVAVGVDTRRVAAEDHRQAVLRQAHAAQRPQVVVVERGGLDVDHRPAVRRFGIGPLAHLEGAQRVVGVGPGCEDGEHSWHAIDA
jgi:hypothetical protein